MCVLFSCHLQCIYEGEGKLNCGITHLHLSGDRLVAARLNGRIDFLRLETYNQGRQIDWGFMSAYRRSKHILVDTQFKFEKIDVILCFCYSTYSNWFNG